MNINEVYKAGFVDEFNKIAKSDTKTSDVAKFYVDSTIKSNLYGAGGMVAGGAVGAGAGAIARSLLKSPKAKKYAIPLGALSGAYLAGSAAGIAGHGKATQKFLKKQTGRDISVSKSLGKSFTTIVPRSVVGSVAGTVAGMAVGTLAKNPVAKIGLQAAGGLAGGLYGFNRGAKRLAEKNK